MCPLNKLFKVFYLSFLYFNLFLQIYDFNFELRLLILVPNPLTIFSKSATLLRS